MKKIILASNSPRRKEILSKFNIDFTVITANVCENNSKHYDEQIVINNSLSKASAVRPHAEGIILAADTVVILNSVCLVKPQNIFEAFFMLKNLSEKTHLVVTAHTLINTENNKTLSKISKTYVTFRKLCFFEIVKYLILKKPFDKAGSYGIQDFADESGNLLPEGFIKEINGSYYNVVGLDIELVKSMLKEI